MKYKDKGKSPPKGYNKQRRTYIAWESNSDSSSTQSSSDSDETANLCLMAHTKNVSYHKKKINDKKVKQAYYNNFSSMSFSELKIAFEKLHNEAVDAFKRLSSDKQIFSFLEGKVYKAEKDLEWLKVSIAETSKNIDIDGCNKVGYCEACHIWQQEDECLASVDRRWFLDSGCSRHMTGDISLFIDFKAKKKGYVTYGDNNKGAVLGKGISNLSPYSMTLVSGFLAVISVNIVIAFYIYLAMREPADKHEPDPKFLAEAKASINQSTGDAQQSSQPLKKQQ
ncbi:uncharacterized protein LOC127084983 isoform X3 [Lathyrus oleraceus]|uniref:uncharacterized protein LOC127084983 isoform X3 n=1 Tax=Pisum sativum TaxID=3888 RepID=UPI0021D30682|nr:uncharacterized protein LOC127084983 isoform X3 [Pisum sativum]